MFKENIIQIDLICLSCSKWTQYVSELKQNILPENSCGGIGIVITGKLEQIFVMFCEPFSLCNI